MKILITGGSSDIAKEMVKVYQDMGHELYVTSSSDEKRDELKSLYEDKNLKATCITFNFKSPGDEINNLIGIGIDGLILNAWMKVEELKLFHDFTDSEVDDELNGNISANIWLLRKILPSMKENKFGRILFISTAAITTGASRYGLYALSKSAIEGVIRNLAVDYGPFNILSNVLRPGLIKTERTRRFWEREYYVERMTKAVPQKRMGEPREIAKATIPFMDKESYINGASLNVSGGIPLFSTKGVVK